MFSVDSDVFVALIAGDDIHSSQPDRRPTGLAPSRDSRLVSADIVRTGEHSGAQTETSGKAAGGNDEEPSRCYRL